MKFLKRKRGTPRQIGKPFPVAARKKLPKISKKPRTIHTNKPKDYGKLVDARTWLEKQRNHPSAFAASEFDETKEAIDYVKELERFGTVKLKVDSLTRGWFDKTINAFIEEHLRPYAETLIVKVKPEKETDFLKFVAGQYISEFDEIRPRTYRLWWS